MRTAILTLVLAAASAAAAEEHGQGSYTPPDWLQPPSADVLQAVWPKDALARGQEGQALLNCEVELAGDLRNCTVVSEEPAGAGFGAAALQAASSFALKPATMDGKPVVSTVRIPLAFKVPKTSVIVAADWLKQPNVDELQAVWPKAALAKGRGGSAVMECEIEPQGTLERCSIVSEEPAGMGFGAAALLLAPSFARKPSTRDGVPIKGRARIPINFKAEGSFDPMSLESVSMIQEPIWASAPGFEDMKAAWPTGAKADAGHVSMRCRLTREGTLHYCDVLSEAPQRQGFGKAAKSILVSKFRLRVDPAAADKISRAYVNLAFHFNNPALNTPRAVVEPTWITGPDPARAQAIYPARAADAGVKSAKGFADCTVAADGHLADCKPAGALPEGLGFGEAAVQVASVMQMNPWTNGGGPVDGVRIRLPIAFNLASEPKP